MAFSSVQDHVFDMDVHEVLQPNIPKLIPFSTPSYPPGLLEPLMVRELMDVCDDDQFKEAHPELASNLLDGFSDPESLIFLPPPKDDVDPETERDVFSDEDRIRNSQPDTRGTFPDGISAPSAGVVNLDNKTTISPEPTAVISRRVTRTRMDLPLIIRHSTIISRPDSGSEENIMMLDLAQSLHLQLDSTPEHQREFRMANGKLVKAVGRTMADCCFAKDPTVELRCLFYVFQQLISPLIMGMAFLEETQTLARNRHRLESRMIPRALPLQLCSLDYPRRRLYCLADLQPKLANADTGSELDLMSLKYVQKRGFVVQEVDLADSLVQFADGSLARLLGKVQVCISFGDGSSARHSREFHVLEGLTCDILLGEDFLNSTAAFQSYSEAFAIDADDDGICEVNAIVWFNVLESSLAQVFSKNVSGSDQSSGKSLCQLFE
ncbi:MAG: hypothetical protein Q9196_005673, partial [Gyalolechia fulgens]